MKRYIKSAVTDISNEDISTQLEVLRDPNISPDILWQFANAKPVIQFDVAKNPNAPEDLLRELYSHNLFGINKELAGNPSTPADILDDILSIQNISLEILKRIAKNPNTSVTTLIKIYDRPVLHPEVKEQIAANSNTPIDILLDILKTGNLNARSKARNKLWELGYDSKGNRIK